MMRIVIIAIKSNAISQSPPQRCMLDFMNILSSFANVQNTEILNIASDKPRKFIGKVFKLLIIDT